MGRGRKHSISIAIKRMTQSFHLETGTKQCEQAPEENDSTLDCQQDIGIATHLRKMPENDDREQRATKNKTEAS